MKRILAIVAAGLMIIVALVVRAALDDDGGSGGASAEDLRITCVTELRKVCAEFDGAQIQEAGATVSALGTGDTDAQVWVTFEGWAEIADITADRSVTGTVAPVASTRLAIVIWNDRAAELQKQACVGAIGWRCLGEAGGRPWSDIGSSVAGEVKFGLPSPSSAVGLLLLGNAIAGFLDRTDFGTNDFEAEDAFPAWLDGIQSGASSRDPLNEMLTVGRAAYAAVGTTEAAAQSLGAQADELDVLHLAPEARVRVVLVAVKGTNAKSVEQLAKSDDLLDALEDAGFDVPAEPASGLPDPDVLAALRTL